MSSLSCDLFTYDCQGCVFGTLPMKISWKIWVKFTGTNHSKTRTMFVFLWDVLLNDYDRIFLLHMHVYQILYYLTILSGISNKERPPHWFCYWSLCHLVFATWHTSKTYTAKLTQWPDFSEHDDATKWKPFPRYWPFVRGIHRSPVKSPHKVQWRGVLMFSLILAWTNGWINNRKAGDLRRHRAHCDVTVMKYEYRQSCAGEVNKYKYDEIFTLWNRPDHILPQCMNELTEALISWSNLCWNKAFPIKDVGNLITTLLMNLQI